MDEGRFTFIIAASSFVHLVNPYHVDRPQAKCTSLHLSLSNSDIIFVFPSEVVGVSRQNFKGVGNVVQAHELSLCKCGV
jgi:hypothetical protein